MCTAIGGPTPPAMPTTWTPTLRESTVVGETRTAGSRTHSPATRHRTTVTPAEVDAGNTPTAPRKPSQPLHRLLLTGPGRCTGSFPKEVRLLLTVNGPASALLASRAVMVEMIVLRTASPRTRAQTARNLVPASCSVLLVPRIPSSTLSSGPLPVPRGCLRNEWGSYSNEHPKAFDFDEDS